MRQLLAIALLLGSFFLTACAQTVAYSQQTHLVPTAKARWALLPVANYADTAQAGERVEGLLEAQLRDRGISTLERYPAPKEDEAHLSMSEAQRRDEALAWARTTRVDYAVLGSVVEWRYKGTIDGEPAVGISLSIVEVPTGKTVFSASGARTGASYDSLSGTALHLLRDLLGRLGTVP